MVHMAGARDFDVVGSRRFLELFGDGKVVREGCGRGRRCGFELSDDRSSVTLARLCYCYA